MKQGPAQSNLAALLATVVGQVGCITVLIIGLALGAGLLLDKFLGTKAIFTVVLMLGSVPVSLYIIVRLSMNAAARAQSRAITTEAEEKTET